MLPEFSAPQEDPKGPGIRWSFSRPGRAIVTNFFELLLAAGSRPAAVIGWLIRLARAPAVRRRERRRLRTAPVSILSDHVRRDLGLPPVDSGGLPL
jgi:hypothetical protein